MWIFSHEHTELYNCQFFLFISLYRSMRRTVYLAYTLLMSAKCRDYENGRVAQKSYDVEETQALLLWKISC